MTTARLEAFSDNVFTIAATLLVLNIAVPPLTSRGGLAGALGHEWPSFVAYALSFATIGIIWINHHAMVRRLKAVDHAVHILNLALLMTVGILPFTTALMAAYLKSGHGEHLAAAIYAGSFLVMGIAFQVMQRHITLRRTHLLAVELTEAERRAIVNRSALGLPPYLLATAIAIVSPYATLALCGLLAAFYALPRTTADRRGA
ncbi:MAG TPA: TMEM175 family protein [Solirubrobacteraceae bacterium]|nr:TMEM175 family protein [Solirubrobacteraceae bacterium]